MNKLQNVPEKVYNKILFNMNYLDIKTLNRILEFKISKYCNHLNVS